ncbi:hypothetical protein QTP86_008996 [Hemibagrus guttatus]|nr:hypothetical protein QTP86_008996 [Hemibagrus guttatus]
MRFLSWSWNIGPALYPPQGARGISRHSQGLEGVWFGDHRISSLIFADDDVLLAPSSLDLQHALGRFAAECEAAGMRVSTSKSEAMVLDRKKMACTLQVGGEFLPRVEEFKYLRALFTSEGRMDREIDRRIGAMAAVMRSMYQSVVVKKELSRKAKLSIYQSIYVPTLTYGHELWVMTERIRPRIQAAEINFLRRVAGHSLRDRVRSSVTWEELEVEPLFLHIERGQLRWLGHLFRMPLGRLPGEVFRACPTGKRPQGRPRTRWRDYVSRLAWERLGVPLEELEEVSVEREDFLRHFLNKLKNWETFQKDKEKFGLEKEKEKVGLDKEKEKEKVKVGLEKENEKVGLEKKEKENFGKGWVGVEEGEREGWGGVEEEEREGWGGVEEGEREGQGGEEEREGWGGEGEREGWVGVEEGEREGWGGEGEREGWVGERKRGEKREVAGHVISQVNATKLKDNEIATPMIMDQQNWAEQHIALHSRAENTWRTPGGHLEDT